MATISRLARHPLVLEGITPGNSANASFTPKPGPVPPGLNPLAWSVQGTPGMLVEVTVTTTASCSIQIWDTSSGTQVVFPQSTTATMIFKFASDSLKFQFQNSAAQVPFYVKIQPL